MNLSERKVVSNQFKINLIPLYVSILKIIHLFPFTSISTILYILHFTQSPHSFF